MESTSVSVNTIREVRPDENSKIRFKVRLAGKNVQIDCLYNDTFLLCKDYLTEFDEADVSISVSLKDIDKERRETFEYILPDLGIIDERVALTYDYSQLEPIVVCRKIADALLNYDIVLVHGAAIAIDNKCFIFMAPSGTGKTTHALNWLRQIPGSFIVNGDKPLVDLNKMYVYGTPWCGKENMNTNTGVPLAGLIELKRGSYNTIRKCSFGEIIPCLLQQCYIPKKEIMVNSIFSVLGKLSSITVFELKCNMEEEAAVVAYNGLLG